jgi:hypothetical protein
MVLARGLKKIWTKEILEAVDKNRLLIITPFKEKIKRITSEQAKKRNELILSSCDKVFIPFLAKNGSISKIIEPYENKVLKNRFTFNPF